MNTPASHPLSRRRQDNALLVALTALCALALIWTVRMAFSVVKLARFQEVRWLPANFEIGMFTAAATLPLIVSWGILPSARRFLFLLWTPCLLYVALTALNLALHDPLAGGWRLALWLVIATLFVIHQRSQTRPGDD